MKLFILALLVSFFALALTIDINVPTYGSIKHSIDQIGSQSQILQTQTPTTSPLTQTDLTTIEGNIDNVELAFEKSSNEIQKFVDGKGELNSDQITVIIQILQTYESYFKSATQTIIQIQENVAATSVNAKNEVATKLQALYNSASVWETNLVLTAIGKDVDRIKTSKAVDLVNEAYAACKAYDGNC